MTNKHHTHYDTVTLEFKSGSQARYPFPITLFSTTKRIGLRRKKKQNRLVAVTKGNRSHVFISWNNGSSIENYYRMHMLNSIILMVRLQIGVD